MFQKKSLADFVGQIETLRALLQTGQDLTFEERRFIQSHLEMLLKDLDLNVRRKPQ